MFLYISFSNRLLTQQRCHPLHQLNLQIPKPPLLQMLGMKHIYTEYCIFLGWTDELHGIKCPIEFPFANAAYAVL